MDIFNYGLISIVMPAYNAQKFIKYSIDSVLTQTYTMFELIIIDDCSTDNTISIINDYSRKDNRIKVVRNDINLGVAKTRNKGVSISTGQWIAFIDSDDLWIKDKLQVQLRAMHTTKTLFSFTSSKFINSEGKFFKKTVKAPGYTNYFKIRFHNVIPCSSVIISKHVMDNVQMSRDEIHEDYAAWLEILRILKFAKGIKEPLLVYRLHSNSKSANKLKTFKMTYFVYRHVNINPLLSIFFTLSHIFFSLFKYRGLKISARMENLK